MTSTSRVSKTSDFDWSRFISRDEFETFERNIDKSFGDVGRALDSLSKKIDNISSKGTDWRTIWGGLSVFTSVICGIGAIIAWGLLTRIDVNATSIDKNSNALISFSHKQYESEMDILEKIHNLDKKIVENSKDIDILIDLEKQKK